MARLTEPIHLSLPLEPLQPITQAGGSWPFAIDGTHEFAWQDMGFSDLELDAIIELGERSSLQKASTYGNDGPEIRSSSVAFLYPNEHTDWIFRRLTGIADHINRQFFGFDLTGFHQGLQFTRYTAPGQHYQWHTDRGFGIPIRKLSASLLLSDPETFQGGDLELGDGPEAQAMERKRGRIIFFPAWVRHRVTPVTEGTRYSLVAWIGGPPFR